MLINELIVSYYDRFLTLAIILLDKKLGREKEASAFLCQLASGPRPILPGFAVSC